MSLVLHPVFVKPVNENDLPEPDGIDDPAFSLIKVLYVKKNIFVCSISLVFFPQSRSRNQGPGHRGVSNVSRLIATAPHTASSPANTVGT